MDYKGWFRRLLPKWGIPIEQTTGTVATTSAGSATTTATASAAGGKFEVFLSFYGKDTRHGFADYLYNDLEEARIRTFRDNEALHVGEEIGAELLKAIEDSKISIPIFSKNYASSKWCLGELVQMVECRESGQKIFPIFYDVEPSDVRHQTGSYKKAFRIHKKFKRSNKKSEETVEKWKKALREVGQLKGWELQKETNGHEGQLVKIVVRKVLLELKKNYMVPSEDLVGIDHHLKAVMGLLNDNSTNEWIVGIHGMGGIGKTTIAKVIYNQLLEKFECCCFLADVREESKSSTGLLKLQNQLISNILGGKPLNIANVDEGMNMIKETVYRKKVLIVLDDVDEKQQFDNLLRKCDRFVSGSRIIVTTRNKAVLNFLGVDKAYEVPHMEFNHSLQLFSRHAFREDLPPEDYDGLSRKITLTAAGLPLALEIIGSSLNGKKKAIWEETLIKLKKIPNEDVQKKLRISYDDLEPEQKQIFLDIACHFIGESSINPFYMWKDCEFYPTIGVDELVLRSLVQIEGNDVLRMHDHLRDLGRDIIRKESSNRPEECSRLYLHDNALGILKRQEGAKTIQTLCMDRGRIFYLETDYEKLHFTDKEFRQLPNLRFLRLNRVELTGDFKHLFSELRWLDWYGCLGNVSPTNFHLKNLVVLNLTGCKITDEWEAWSQIKEAKKLKALYLRGCKDLTRTPDFSTFATLEILDISKCQNLCQIDPSIEDLINLRVLKVRCTGITKLPDAIGNLKKLEEIDASDGFNLRGEIQSSIGRLSSLRILRLVDTKICSLPTSIRRLSSLQTLELEGCAELQSLPELPPSLTSLNVTCELFPSLSNLMNLKELYFYFCSNLVEIPGDIGKLSKLESLTFLIIINITSLPAEIGALSCLKKLEVRYCSKLMEIQGLEKLERLTSLDISWCESLERFSDLSNLKQLKKLDAKGCKKLIEIQGLDRLESLQHLNMKGCECIKTLADLSNLRMLKKLNLDKCEKLAEVRGLWGLKSLETLKMSSCTSLKRLPSLSNLGMLKNLRLSGCEKLAEVESLGALKSLETLNISDCTSLERLPDLSNLKNLRKLMIDNCGNLTEIRGLEELKSLQWLGICGCDWIIGKLPDLPNTRICPYPMRKEDERRTKLKKFIESREPIFRSWGLN